MHRLTAAILIALGAPQKGGAQEIEDWLRVLLKRGTVRLQSGLVELRGSEPVVTTLGELKQACGVAVETIKHGLRTLEMDHWVALVDGAHTRLLGPPRFSISITKENIWGSVGQAIEVSPSQGLSPLECIDYEQLRHKGNTVDRKARLVLEPVTLEWTSELRFASRDQLVLKGDEQLTLAAGSQVRDEEGQAGVLESDLKVEFAGSHEAALTEQGHSVAQDGERVKLPAKSIVHLEGSSIARLANGQTGILEVRPRAALESGEVVDWGDDAHWLARFRSGRPLVFLRRAIYVVMKDVVASAAGNPESDEWRVAVGVHDCFLDGSIPFLAGESTLRRAPAKLASFLGMLGAGDSLRGNIEKAYGFTVGSADVRVSPTQFASSYDRKLLAQVGQNGPLNSEILSLSHKVPCWSQVGAYYRRNEKFPWEITRELYFTFVHMSYRQSV